MHQRLEIGLTSHALFTGLQFRQLDFADREPE
jgi:hypothetical protein